MKRVVFVVVFVLCIVFAVYAVVPRILIAAAHKTLQKTFPQSSISITGCVFKPLRQIGFRGVTIKQEPLYSVTIDEAGIWYTFGSLVRRVIPGVYVSGAAVTVSSSQELIPALQQLAVSRGNAPKFSIEMLDLEKVRLDIESPDVAIQAEATIQLGIPGRRLYRAVLTSPQVRVLGVTVKGFSLNAEAGSEGELTIQEARFNKARVRNVQSAVTIGEDDVAFGITTAEIINGIASGEFDLRIDTPGAYSGHLEFTHLDLERFVSDFELQEKFRLSGTLSGYIDLEGVGPRFDIINGKLTANDPGGTLIVTDTRFLAGIAQRSDSSVDILVEGFKDYQYTIGELTLGIEDKNLISRVRLDGAKGKRELDIILHDFK